MNTGFTLFFYGLSAILLSLSFRKDREKTNRAVRKAVFITSGSRLRRGSRPWEKALGANLNRPPKAGTTLA